MPMRTQKRQIAWDKTCGRCFYCGTSLREDIAPEFSGLPASIGSVELMQVDHKHSRARGGTDDADNLYPACLGCNSEKGARDIEAYRLAKGLSTGKMPHRFACEPSAPAARDYLLVGSAKYRGEIVRASFGPQ